MFYEHPERSDRALRFGDILEGFATCTPTISDPPLSPYQNYRIEISTHPFYVVLSPCCSITDKKISLAPLIKVRNSLFNNPFFEEDLTRVNEKIPPEKAIPPQALAKMDEEEKINRLNAGLAYSLLELFIYKEHDMFSEYEVHLKGRPNIRTRYYMIDFRTAFLVDCEKIIAPHDAPLKCKCLQLTTKTRSMLRDKITCYFSRIPDEEKAELM